MSGNGRALPADGPGSGALSPGAPGIDAAGEYVVRWGWRGFLVVAGWLAFWSLLGVIAFTSRPATVWGALVFAAGAVTFAALTVTRARLALRRAVVLAVGPRGIFLGPASGPEFAGAGPEAIAWSRICAVELFRERVTHGKGAPAATGASACARPVRTSPGGRVPGRRCSRCRRPRLR